MRECVGLKTNPSQRAWKVALLGPLSRLRIGFAGRVSQLANVCGV
jgi:hypothetical protein